MLLPAIDTGLMSEHLTAHQGVISRLKGYQMMVANPNLSRLLHYHIQMLQRHVETMLALMNPNTSQIVTLADLGPITFNQSSPLTEQEAVIVKDALSSAKLMAANNFESALRMQNRNVKDVHVKMAYQDAAFQMYYQHLLQLAQRAPFVPMMNAAEQRKAYQAYAQAFTP